MQNTDNEEMTETIYDLIFCSLLKIVYINVIMS